MKKIILFLLLQLALTDLFSQNLGLSFNYFIPKHGYFSTPVSPFSLRGVGVNLNRFIALQTGASLYRMSGLAMKDLPLKSNDPFVGPNFTLFVPAELVIQLRGQGVQLDLKGGGFFFYGFGQTLNYGNIDNAVRSMEGWEVANSSLSFQNKPGIGWQAGAELTISITNQFSLSIETNYLSGQSKMPLQGSYTGGTTGLETKSVDYKDAKVDFTGLEFSIGLLFNTGGGGSKPKRRR
jgi:hypothetical protein